MNQRSNRFVVHLLSLNPFCSGGKRLPRRSFLIGRLGRIESHVFARIFAMKRSKSNSLSRGAEEVVTLQNVSIPRRYPNMHCRPGSEHIGIFKSSLTIRCGEVIYAE